MIQSSDRIIDRRRGWEARIEMEILAKPQEELSTYDKMVYVALCGHADRNGGAFPTVAKLATMASCSTRQVFRALTVLEQRGLIVRSAQVTPGEGQTGNLYEVHGIEDYISPTVEDRCDSQAQGADVTDSHTPHDCQSHPYIRSSEQLQKNSKDYSPSGSGDTSPADTPRGETPPQTEDLPVSEAPEAMRPTANYLLLNTGRAGLQESEISALRTLNATHYPARVQAEIDRLVGDFRRRGRDLCELTFVYIAGAMRNRKPTRDPTGKKTPPKTPSREPDDDFSGMVVRS